MVSHLSRYRKQEATARLLPPPTLMYVALSARPKEEHRLRSHDAILQTLIPLPTVWQRTVWTVHCQRTHSRLRKTLWQPTWPQLGRSCELKRWRKGRRGLDIDAGLDAFEAL